MSEAAIARLTTIPGELHLAEASTDMTPTQLISFAIGDD